MRYFVTGASGFIGSAVVQDLIAAGHQVLGLARSDASAKAVAAAGAEVLRGALDDLESLKRGASGTDGVIHTAYVHDFSNIEASARIDELAIETLGDALAGSHRPLVVASGVAHLKPGRVSSEEDVPDPASPAAHRIPPEAPTLALAKRGVRSVVLRLPPTVHGDGDPQFIPAVIRVAREKGVSAYIGEGKNRWPAVHRLDAASAFRLAADKAPAGSRVHAVGEEGVATREIAEVIGRRLGVPVVSRSAQEAAAHFGWIARFFGMDCPSSSAQTQARLGWKPTHVGLIEDLERGTYFAR